VEGKQRPLVNSSDEHTSTDSIMEEIKAKKISHSAKAMKQSNLPAVAELERPRE